MKNEKEEKNIRAKLKYHFDECMGRGAKAQFVLLFVALFLLILVVGIAIGFVNGDDNYGSGMWQTLMHLIDQGTITGDDIDSHHFLYLFVMLIITICGMVLTGAIIAIINNALDFKLNNLRKGKSTIIEDNHTIIVGFDDNIYCVLEEILMANENEKKRQCIVVIDENADKESMEQLIAEHLKSVGDKSDSNKSKRIKKHTKIVCRTGKIVQDSLYKKVSMESAKSIIINNEDDFQIVRILLAITDYLKSYNKLDTNITTLLHNSDTINSAEFAVQGFDNARIMYFEEYLARIIAQVCRQPGLSSVLSIVFSFSGQEFYIESQNYNEKFAVKGECFSDVLNEFQNATVLGIQEEKSEKIIINPAPTTKVQSGSTFLLLEEDDNNVKINQECIEKVNYAKMKKYVPNKAKKLSFLILDWNESLPTIISVLNDFAGVDSFVRIVSDREYNRKKLSELNNLPNITVEFQKEPNLYQLETMERLLEEEYTNVLLLCEDGIGPDAADAQTAMLLLHLRKVLSEEKNVKKYENLIITSEMNTTDDQKLLQDTCVNDFVVGSEIANRIMAQVSQQPKLHNVYLELLDASGSELYLRPAFYYFENGVQEASFAEITHLVYHFYDKSGTLQNDIPIGYKIGDDICLNPEKSQKVEIGENTFIIVVSNGDSKNTAFGHNANEQKQNLHEIDANGDIDGAIDEIRDIIEKRLM